MDSATVSAISTVGFPIVACMWFMWRQEAIIKNNTDAMIKNSEALSIVAEHLRKERKIK